MGGKKRRCDSHLHVSEALDAEHGLVLCREQDAGLLVESCGDNDLT